MEEQIDMLTTEEIADIDRSIGHGKTLVALDDSCGDTHSIWVTEACLPVIRVGHSDDDKTEAYRITVRGALILVDSAGLNTTANELRERLDTVSLERNRLMLWLTAAGCSDRQINRIADGKAIESDDLSPREIGVGLELAEAKRQLEEARELFKRAQELIKKHEKLAEEQNAIIAEANQTITQLRQDDTVRPAVDVAEVWPDDGGADRNAGVIPGNYR